MPYCKVSTYQQDKFSEGIRIFYERYGRGDIKVLLIIGLAGTHNSWDPQIRGLAGFGISNSEEGDDESEKEEKELEEKMESNAPVQDLSDNKGDVEWLRDSNCIEVCSFDNRGVGRSSVPKHRSFYTTTIMARDALALMDHLGWKKAHVFGHSMGAMIACKLAAIEPSRISSLALLNATGGGFECFPKVDWTMISIVFRFLKARTPQERAAVDLDTHYTKEFLESYVESGKRRAILYEEYVRNISASGMQSKYGFDGHVNACWTHKITSKEYETIRTAGFLVAVTHGRHDIIAQVRHGRKISKKLHPAARMIELHGGHLVSHEKPKEVNQTLKELIVAAESSMHPLEWVKKPQLQISNGKGEEIQDVQSPCEDDSSNCFYSIWRQMQIYLCYFLGLLMILWEHVINICLCFKKEKVKPDHDPSNTIDHDFNRTIQPSSAVLQY